MDAGKVGMDGYFANVLPHQKQEKIKAFQAKGEDHTTFVLGCCNTQIRSYSNYTY